MTYRPRFVPRLASLLLLLGSPAAAAEPTISAAEARLAAFVDAHAEESIGLLQRLVDVNSGTMNLDGVREVGAMLRVELDALGFETHWLSGDDVGRGGHLVAERQGRGPRLLLIGHLDTVFELDSPFQRFERQGEWLATGPGLIDMKGGDVILLLALRALAAEGILDEMTVRVIFTGDEEAPGAPLEKTRGSLIDLARQSDFAIGFEDGDGDPATAVISRRGSGGWTLRTSGVRAHSSLIHNDDVGSGAIYEAARILAAFHDLREPHLTLSPGLVLGGTRVDHDPAGTRGTAFGKGNVVAEGAVVTGDLRPFSLEQRQQVQGRMREIVGDHLPRTEAEIVFKDSYPPMAPSDGNRRLLEIFDQVSRDLGGGPVGHAHLGKLGAADVSFTAPYVQGALDGLGLGGQFGHSVHEQADLRTLPVQAKRAALLLHRLWQGGNASASP